MLFAADVGSNPTVTVMIHSIISIICSGMAYDAIKSLFLSFEGVGFMKDIFVLLISWLGCYGYVVQLDSMV